MYILSALLSAFALVTTIALMFAESDSAVHMFLNDNIAYGCIVIAFVLLVIGLILEVRENRLEQVDTDD